MKITIKLLKKMPSGRRACKGAIGWFIDKFPEGAELEEAWSTCPVVAWKVWFAYQWLPAEARQALTYRLVGQAFRFASQVNPSLVEYADNVTADNLDEAREAADKAIDIGGMALHEAAREITSQTVPAVWEERVNVLDTAREAAKEARAATLEAYGDNKWLREDAWETAWKAQGACRAASRSAVRATGEDYHTSIDAGNEAASVARKEQLEWCWEALTLNVQEEARK
jgi:hypothetical protein